MRSQLKFTGLFLGILLLTAACASGNAAPDLSSYETPQDVKITFNALAPENTAADAQIRLAVVDILSGLEFNTQYFPMESQGERSHSVTLSAPRGSLLLYRYIQQASEALPEASASGAPILYRLYLVDGPGHVSHDIIAAWSGTAVNLPTGQVSGTVVSVEGQPLAGISLSASGLHTQTNAAGQYVLNGLPRGLHTITAYSEEGSFLPFQQGALVAEGTDTPANITLIESQQVDVTISVSPPADMVPGVPLYVLGNLPQFSQAGPLSLGPDGLYTLNLQLPAGLDIRYKYTLGDGFWNAEHVPDGNFVLRQLILPEGENFFRYQDWISNWTSGASQPIWFDLQAPKTGGAYIQFKLVDWAPPIPMWSLGAGHFAYKLYSPTNFAEALSYHYCLDSLCLRPEAGAETRLVSGNQDYVQMIEDQVEAWSE